MTNGTLTDKGMNDDGVVIARIDDKPFPVMPHVLPYLEKIEKGQQVDFFLKEGKISKIARVRNENDKRQQAGFNNPPPAQEPKKDCTSSDSPANPSNSTGLKTVEGQIILLDAGAHKVSLKDRAGTVHTFIWGPALHDKMSKLQQWWFAKLTGELTDDGETWKLISQDFFKRPDDWPASGGRKGGFGGQPRNEKMILVQCVFKEVCDTARAFIVKPDEVMDEAEFIKILDICEARTVKISKALIDAAGGA